MAETTTTITRPAPVLEASLTNFLKAIDPLVGQKIDTSAYAPQIAAESQLQQDARTAVYANIAALQNDYNSSLGFGSLIGSFLTAGSGSVAGKLLGSFGL